MKEWTPEELKELYQKYKIKIQNTGTMHGDPYDDSEEGTKVLKFIPPEDVELILQMKYEWQTAAEFAEMTGMPEEEAEEKLYAASKHGGVYRKLGPDGKHLYSVTTVAHGIWEFMAPLHAKESGPDWIPDTLGSLMAVSSDKFVQPDCPYPFWQVLPVEKEVVAEGEEYTEWDDVDSYIKNATAWNVWDCACMEIFHLGGAKGMTTTLLNGETVPMDSEPHIPRRRCLVLNDMAAYYNENGWGTTLTMEEALDLKNKYVREYNSIAQVYNSKKGEVVCFCDARYCPTTASRMSPNWVGSEYTSRFIPVRDTSKCVRCGACIEACQIKKHTRAEDGSIVYNPLGCAGCGQCARACKNDALKLHRRPGFEGLVPPDDMVANNFSMASWAGFIGKRPFDPEYGTHIDPNEKKDETPTINESLKISTNQY